MMNMRRGGLIAIFVGTALALAAWIFWRREIIMNEKVTLPPMKTICVGRHLMALPSDLSLRGDVDLVYGLDKNFKTVKVEVLRESGMTPTFDALVNKKVAELTAQSNEDVPSKNMLAGWRKIDEDTVLIRANTEISERGFFTALVVVQRGAAVGLVTADIFDHDKPEDIEAKALAVAKSISFVSDPEKAGKGTCLGPLLINANQDGEWISVSGRSASHPDVNVDIHVNSLVAESDGGLLKRVEEKSGPMAKMGMLFKPIRKGNVVIAGRPGEEFLESDKDEQGKVFRLYNAETLITKPSTFSEPSFTFHLNMGGQLPNSDQYVDASFDEAQSLALWDSIIKSIRLRPGSI